ncbi:hypothetical protein BDY24DRAFT_377612 [Mrakia frigida]|uniref:uncharacterized protein n=1 Tax=Mrakia frigida TaxID=29902 RepID=UPI003FCC0CD6
MSISNPGEINFFQILHQERTTYGLRSGDYARYHKHLSSRLSKLRSTLKLQHTSGQKPKPFKKLPALKGEEIKDARILEMVLLEAERAHTTSLALHQTYLSSPAATRHSSTLHNSHTRSSKSLSHASNLLSLLLSLPSSNPTSPRSLGQAKIYHLVLQAGLAFKKEDYESALPAYIVARTLLAQLAEGEETPRGEALALGWMDEEVDPRIRFCAYKLGRKDSHDVAGIVAEFGGDELVELLQSYDATEVLQVLEGWTGEEGRERKKMGKVVWLEREIEFRNADVVGVMEKVEKALKRLEGATGAGGKKMRAYDRVLGELGEAFEKVKRIRSEGQASSSTSTAPTPSQTDSLALLQDYLLHSLLSNRIARDLLLVKTLLRPTATTTKVASTSSKPASKAAPDLLRTLPSVIKLYDGVIKGWEAIRELGAVEADGEVSEAVEAKIGFFRAKRIYHLASLHLLLASSSSTSTTEPSSSSPTTKSLLLLSRASLLLRQILSLPKTYPPSDLNPLTEADLNQLEEQITELEGQAKRTLYDETVGKEDGGKKTKFLDLAFNFVELERKEVVAPAKEKKADAAVTVGGGEKKVEKKVESEEEEEEEDEQEEEEDSEEEEPEQKKGWLGGWFGRK